VVAGMAAATGVVVVAVAGAAAAETGVNAGRLLRSVRGRH
jgi:hypothetical protein